MLELFTPDVTRFNLGYCDVLLRVKCARLASKKVHELPDDCITPADNSSHFEPHCFKVTSQRNTPGYSTGIAFSSVTSESDEKTLLTQKGVGLL